MKDYLKNNDDTKNGDELKKTKDDLKTELYFGCL